ncbi:MAG: hypothetical protein WCO97_05105 [bacterium]
MKPRMLDHRLRRVPDADSATFEEDAGGTRGLRLIKVETLTALAAHYSGQTAGKLGRGEMGDIIDIAGFSFEFEPGRQGWVFEGPQSTIILRDTCHPQHADKWLRVFMEVEKDVPGLLYVKEQTHIVGADDPSGKYVASARGATVTWFNHSSGHLLAVGLEDITKGSGQAITMKRMLHHECAHLLEDGMKDWLTMLTDSILKDATIPRMRALGEILNPQYLPTRTEHTAGAGLARKEAEEMAAEFLVEIYAHSVIEKLAWPDGVWQEADTVAKAMQEQSCHDPEGRILRIQTPSESKRRVMLLPKTITVSDVVARNLAAKPQIKHGH